MSVVTNQQLYSFFLPESAKRFRKTRWLMVTIIQELLMGKYLAVWKYYTKAKYRKDINVLKNLLAPHKLYGRKSTIYLREIHMSHEINYPDHVQKLAREYSKYPRYAHKAPDIPHIKVILNDGEWLVVDGNHRLMAMEYCFNQNQLINVLILSTQKVKIKCK